MQYTTSDVSFRHFKLLRKAITHKKTGVLQFQSMDGFNGLLLFEQGDLNATKKNKHLIRFLSHPVKTSSWEDENVNIDRTPAIEVITDAINRIQWSDEHLRLISEMFATFSHLEITFKPAVFKNSLTDLSYHLFYQRINAKGDYCVSKFMLKNNPSNALLIHRVRVLTFNYVLGLIRANKGSLGVKSLPQKQVKKTNKNTTTIRRIMGRIRSLSATP